MATAFKNSLTDHSVKDGTGDPILGSEVDINPNLLADILDGTVATDLGGAAAVDFLSARILDLDNATGAVQTNLTIEWDPADGNQMTDNSSGVGIDFKMPDDADNQDIFASLNVMCVSDATGAEEGEFSFKGIDGGSAAEWMTLSGAGMTLGVSVISDVHVGNGQGLVVGHTAQMTAGGVAQEMQVLGTGAADSQMVLGRFSADAAGPVLTFAKSRDPAIFDGSFAIVADDDQIGAIYATLDDGTDFAQIAASINFVVDDGTPAENATGGSIEFHTVNASGSGAERMRINEAGDVHVANDVVLGATSEMFFGDTANAEVTTGLTINQGAADDFAIALKSSDVANGNTDRAETDTWGSISKSAAATGGISIRGYHEGTQAVNVISHYTTDSTTKTAGADAPIALWSWKKSGTGSGAPGSNGNICVIGDYANGAQFIVDAEGDLFANGSATTVYDDRDDMALLSAFDRDSKGFIEQDWERNLAENEKALIDIGILGGPRVGVPVEERGLISYTGLARLHNSALRQVYTKLVETVERLTVAENKLKMLEA